MISNQTLPAAPGAGEPTEQTAAAAAEIKARKPAWNVAAVAGQEAGPIMGAAAWPSLGSNAPSQAKGFSPKSAGTPNSSSSDSLKSLSDGSAASGSVIQKSAPSPESVLVQAAPPPQSKPNANPNPNPNPTRRDNPNPNRSSKWNNNNNNRRNYNNNNNNYHNNNNNNNYRGREKGGPNWNNNNNNNNWNNNGNNGNSLHQRPQHFYRPNLAATPPPPPPVSFGFTAPPVPPAFYGPMGFAEFPFPVMGPVPLIAAAPQFMPQLSPPLILSAGEVERRNAILKQIEYYFSTENLCKDVYLRKNMDEQGWVPISLIAGFNRVKQLTTDMQYILDVIQGSSVLEVQGDKIRARNNWMNWIFTERMQGLNITPPLTTGRNT